MRECEQGAVHRDRMRHSCCEDLERLTSLSVDATGYVGALELVARRAEEWRTAATFQEEKSAVANLVEALEKLGTVPRPHSSSA